jgi:hypothetical protein
VSHGQTIKDQKTLIPDLRGCQVRTPVDEKPMLVEGVMGTEREEGAYIEVTKHSSGLEFKMRPLDSDKFELWLAALLCWQPIPPKGTSCFISWNFSVVIIARSVSTLIFPQTFPFFFLQAYTCLKDCCLIPIDDRSDINGTRCKKQDAKVTVARHSRTETC